MPKKSDMYAELLAAETGTIVKAAGRACGAGVRGPRFGKLSKDRPLAGFLPFGDEAYEWLTLILANETRAPSEAGPSLSWA